MSSICPDGVLPGRPDIEGIGTRVATYAQVLLAILTISIQPAVQSFDAWWAVLVTSLGLQFAAIAHRFDLTLFHALVVSWLAFPIFAMSWVYIFVHWREREMPNEIMLATHVHGFLFIGYGLWVWSTAPSFGACPELNGSSQFVILGKSVSPLSWVRIFVLVLYSVWAVMFIAAAITSTMKSELFKKMFHKGYTERRTQRKLALRSNQILILVTLFNLLALASGIWHVEALLDRNETQSVQGDENTWSFGQLAALILLVGPLFTFMRLVRLRFGLWVPNGDGSDGDGDLGNDREGMPIRAPLSKTRAASAASANDRRVGSGSGSYDKNENEKLSP